MKKQSFTMIELIIVIVIVSILVIKTDFTLSNTSLNQAADQLINHINYTRHLALKDNKMQYYPINSDATEMSRSKYWFKQWWQIRFSSSTDGYWYEIFTDLPSSNSHNFTAQGNLPNNETCWNLTYAKNPLNHKYLIGHCDFTQYPSCENADKKLNLTQSYGIVKIKYTNFSKSKRLVFDNYGNCYLREGDDGDAGDTNPYDKDKRIPLLKTAKITLCKDTSCKKNISICITPKVGFAYLCN